MHRAGKIQIAMPQAFFLCSHHSVSPSPLTLYSSTSLVIAWQLGDTSVLHKVMTCINILRKKKKKKSLSLKQGSDTHSVKKSVIFNL